MARATWKGSLGFGLLQMPVSLVKARDETGVKFNQIHSGCGGRIRYRRFCEATGDEVPFGDIAKGYEMADGAMVEISQDDLDALPRIETKTMEVSDFVATAAIPLPARGDCYFIQADPAAAKVYALLHATLTDRAVSGICEIALRSRQRLAALEAVPGGLMLTLLHWPDELRDAAAQKLPDLDTAFSDAELTMAGTLIDSLTGEYDPSKYTDEYAAGVIALVEAKAAGTFTPGQPAEPAAQPDNLLAALEAQVASIAEQRDKTAKTKPAAAKKPAARKRKPAA